MSDGPAAIEELFREIDGLTNANRSSPSRELERRILQLRHRAGLQVTQQPSTDHPKHPAPTLGQLPDTTQFPEVALGELTPGLLRAAILRSGCLMIRGLIDSDDASRLAHGIDRAYEARQAQASGTSADGTYYEEFEPDARFKLATQRFVISGAAGLWAADSPRLMLEVIDLLKRSGLGRVAAAYLGERPVLSVNKCVLRKVDPDIFTDPTELAGSKPSGWHQEGAALGDVRALNVWLSLSRCGDEAPGLDIVPRRIDHLLPSGTEGAIFDWSVSRAVAEEAARDAGILRPVFEPGDGLLFDELLLHSTAAEPEMRTARYSVESWFFGASGFPSGYAPLAF